MKKSILKPPFLKTITYTKEADSEENAYPFSVPLFQKDFTFNFTKPITIFVGENGSGKSTLLEYLAYASGFNIRGGSRNHMDIGGPECLEYLKQLESCIKLSWLPKATKGFFMRAETFFNFIEYNRSLPSWGDVEASYGGNPLAKSHGESFLALFANKFRSGGLLLLDEPEAALSPMRQLDFLRVLQEIEMRKNAQIIMITHSPVLMSYPGAEVFHFGYRGIQRAQPEETEHFQLMKRFFADPKAFIKEVLEEE
jgi:predicted ATPase